MTFFECIQKNNKEYDNSQVNYAILFYLSKKVKNQTDFISFRNNEIDFAYNDYVSLLKEYYLDKKPLGHIIKQVVFNNTPIKLLPMVHCPRNETELLVTNIQNIIKIDNKLTKVIDLCAGSGCIGISLKNNINKISLSLLEIDDNSIECIMNNLILNKIQANIYQEDYFDFIKSSNEKFDVIVINPPYVAKKELDSTMTKYENAISFNNSEDEMLFYIEFFNHYQRIINFDHFLIGLEFGYDQKDKINDLIKENNLSKYATFYKDYSNHDRFVIIYKN